MQCIIENIVMILIKNLIIHQISALNNPQRVDMSLLRDKLLSPLENGHVS